MAYTPDPSVDLARAMSLREVMDRLAIKGLARVSGEWTGPCPVCGGRDRFSINEKKAVFNCRHCARSGDTLELVMHVMSCDFLGAVSFLAGEPGVEIDLAELERREARAAAAKKKAEDDSERYRAYARRCAIEVWKKAGTWLGTPAGAYLIRRGIEWRQYGEVLQCLRYLHDHPYEKKIGGQNMTLHRGPCLIAVVQDARGRIGAVHQTWIDLDQENGKARILHPKTGEVMDPKLVRGSKKGGAIRLTGHVCGSTLIMGEGIETTLSAMVAGVVPGASYWAGVDLGNMSGVMEKRPGTRISGHPDMSDAAAFVPPRHIRRLIFVQDGDSEPRMTEARLKSGLRRAKAHIDGLHAQIVHPGAGIDLNDLLQGKTQ
jgi:CHC2 zinc finger